MSDKTIVDYFLIDYSRRFGHSAIIHIQSDNVKSIQIENKPGLKMILKNGTILYVEKISLFKTHDSAKKIFLEMYQKLGHYIEHNCPVSEIIDKDEIKEPTIK